jgi:CMP-N,N'-diacetyllegionaminic acid synthase
LQILALIPARQGSKRIINKNIRPLNGKPLIAYTIEAAKNSKHIHRIIVSTNSEGIASVGRTYGAEVPFLRPDEISAADSTEMEFFDHTLDWLSENEKYEPDIIVLLYPTSPFRKSESIDKAIGLFLKHPEADSLRSIKKCSEHPYKMWVVEKDYLKPFVKNTGKKDMHTLSYHLLPEVYIQNASIYIIKTSIIKDKRSPTGDIIIPFIMDEMESIDINNPIDFELAETMMGQRNKLNSKKDSGKPE